MAKELPVITRNNLAYIVIDSAVLENDTVATRLDRYRAKKAPVYQADTYAELAKQMGVDPEVFTKTMEGYNEAVKSGKAAALTPGNTLKEPRLVVKAPFLALPFSGGMTAPSAARRSTPKDRFSMPSSNRFRGCTQPAMLSADCSTGTTSSALS